MSNYKELGNQVLNIFMEGNWNQGYNLLYEKMNMGDSAATSLFGELYIEGVGVPQDLDYGIAMVEKAVDMGCIEATEVLSGLFLQGKVVPVNKDKAFRYILIGAYMGYPPQMGKLAYTYLIGDMAPEDYSLAFEWAEKAANCEDLLGMITIAMIYKNGYGRKKNPSLAAYWYRKCLQINPEDTGCMADLAICLADPFEEFDIYPTQDDYKEAFSLVWRGMQAGDLSCQLLVGCFYEKGIGTKENSNTAYQYIKDAADKGQEQAKELIKHYRKNIFGKYRFVS